MADWELIALNDRVTYICYDSDVMVKREVYGGLCRLAEFLALRHAHVRYVYLPAGASGAKVGVDDYLAAGHTVEELLGLATTQRRPHPDEQDPTTLPIIHIARTSPRWSTRRRRRSPGCLMRRACFSGHASFAVSRMGSLRPNG